MKIESKNNLTFGMKFTPETTQMAKEAGGKALKYLSKSEKLKSSENYLVHIQPPIKKTFIQRLFAFRKQPSDYWHLCVSNKKEFPELGETFYPFFSFTKNNNLDDVSQVFVADFFVKEKAYNKLAKVSKMDANVDHPPFPGQHWHGII